VRGLTTAASLWVVACVGLTVGAGFYELSIGASLMAFVTLMILKKAEAIFSGNLKVIEIVLENRENSSKIAEIIDIMKKMDIKVENIKMSSQDETSIQVKFFVKLPRGTTIEQVSEKIKLLQ
jgi:putative Mg2+ transporter-C (MgtC) family protein